jgi:mono/diheme cytochrome c family protein
MMRRYRVIFFVGATVSLIALSSSVMWAEGPGDGATKNPFAEDAEAIPVGKLIYEATCAGYCHATESAARQGRCPNLFDCEWKYGNSDSEIFHILSVGVPRTEMVGFKGKLPDEILWKVIAYVRSASQCRQDSRPAAAAAH